MLHMTLGLIVHQERQREIERMLEQRRLLAELRVPRAAAVATPERRIPARQERAGAAS